jgi:multicomponent Na+:H+ antiporter subunit B
MLFGDAFLAHPVFKKELGIKTKYALEGVEILGVAPIVAGIVTGLFFVIASGFTAEDEEVVTDD